MFGRAGPHGGVLPLNLRFLRAYVLLALVQAIALAVAYQFRPVVGDSGALALLALTLGLANLAALAGMVRWVDRGTRRNPLEADVYERLAENIQSLDRTNRELRAARDQVVHSARLASVGTLAAGIAHEVGNPLGAIIGFVDVARGRAKKGGEDTELLDSIRGEAGRIDRIVRGLLDYARPPAQDAAPASVTDVVEGVRELLDSQGKLDLVTTTWDSAVVEARLVEEPYRLQQVLVNLLLNALHAVRDVKEPKITVSLGEQEGEIVRMPARREDDPAAINYMHRRRDRQDAIGIASVAGAERLVRIEVADNGPGITPDVAEYLFDPFFTTKDPGEGTGLGLAICARLLDGMGGRIEVDTPAGGGARFVILLPALYDSEPHEGASADGDVESP